MECKAQATTKKMLEDIRCSVRELEELIESELEADCDLNSDIDLPVDNDSYNSEDEEIWNITEDLSNADDEDDSTENFSDTVDSVKEKFLSLVQHQTSLVKQETSVNDTVESPSSRENEKPRTMEGTLENESSNNGMLNISENSNTDRGEQQNPAKWGIYDRFPSVFHITEEMFEDDVTYDYDDAYEGFTCN